MIRKTAIGVVVTLLVLTATGTVYLCLNMNRSKTAFVDLNKVYDSFRMKKELENKLESVEQQRKNILDTMELHLRIFSGQIDQSKTKDPEQIQLFNGQREAFLEKEKQFEQDNSSVRQQYMDQVAKQLNEYVNEYGKKHGYKYIFGADGSGVIMHADDKENITDQVIAYVNERYKGNQ